MLNICIINKQIAYDKLRQYVLCVFIFKYTFIHTYICIFNLYNTIYKRYLY